MAVALGNTTPKSPSSSQPQKTFSWSSSGRTYVPKGDTWNALKRQYAHLAGSRNCNNAVLCIPTNTIKEIKESPEKEKVFEEALEFLQQCMKESVEITKCARASFVIIPAKGLHANELIAVMRPICKILADNIRIFCYGESLKDRSKWWKRNRVVREQVLQFEEVKASHQVEFHRKSSNLILSIGTKCDLPAYLKGTLPYSVADHQDWMQSRENLENIIIRCEEFHTLMTWTEESLVEDDSVSNQLQVKNLKEKEVKARVECSEAYASITGDIEIFQNRLRSGRIKDYETIHHLCKQQLDSLKNRMDHYTAKSQTYKQWLDKMIVLTYFIDQIWKSKERLENAFFILVVGESERMCLSILKETATKLKEDIQKVVSVVMKEIDNLKDLAQDLRGRENATVVVRELEPFVEWCLMKKVLCEDLVSLLEKDMQTHLYFYQVDCWCYDVNKSIHQIFEPPPQDVPQQSYGSLMDVMEDTLRRKPGLNPNLLEGHVVITGFLEKTWQESQQKLEKANSKVNQVQHFLRIFEEMIRKEESYIADLELIVKHYLVPASQGDHSVPAIIRSKHKHIFGNIQTLAKFHTEKLLPQLAATRGRTWMLMKAFEASMEEAKEIYFEYCQNRRDYAKIIGTNKAEQSYFWDRQASLGHPDLLPAMLAQPCTRLIQYKVFIESMKKHAPSQKYKHNLSAICSLLDKTVSDINARVRQKYGTPIHSCDMKVQRPGGGLKLRSKLRKVFLYSNYLVIYPLQCKDQVVRPMSPEYWEDCPPKAIIPLSKMAIPEFPKGSKLHMTLSNFETKAGVYNFEIPSEDECKIWKDELSKLLCDQANIIKKDQVVPSNAMANEIVHTNDKDLLDASEEALVPSSVTPSSKKKGKIKKVKKFFSHKMKKKKKQKVLSTGEVIGSPPPGIEGHELPDETLSFDNVSYDHEIDVKELSEDSFDSSGDEMPFKDLQVSQLYKVIQCAAGGEGQLSVPEDEIVELLSIEGEWSWVKRLSNSDQGWILNSSLAPL